MRKAAFILLILQSCNAFGQADSAKAIFDVSARFLYSSIWTGRGALQQFTLDHPWGIQLDLGITKNSQEAWNYCNCYSRNGVSVGYFNFDNPTKLGNAFTVSFFTEPSLIYRDRFSLSIRASAGFAFLNKLYDSVTNKESIFFSSGLSYYLMAGLQASYRLNRNFASLISFQYNHISNGGKRDPNEGLNFPGVSVGLNYFLNPHELKRRPNQKFANKSLEIVAHLFGAQRTAQASTVWPEEVRFASGVNVGLIKRLGRLNGIGVGGEIYYDGLNEVYRQRGQPIQSMVGGASLQHYLFFGKLLFGQQFAWYITPNSGYQKNIYQRYFLEYELIKSWYGGVSLKAHGDHSDFMAISVGHLFRL